MAELSNIRPGGTYEPPKMKPLNGAQWQQPALFTTKPSDEHRYPRGYTPERLHRTASLFPPVDVRNMEYPASYFTKRKAEMTPHYVADAPLTNQEAAEATQHNANTIARHRMVDVIARSSVNTNDLSGLRVVSVAPPGKSGGPSRGAVGTYRAGSSPGFGSIQISNVNDPFQENTLIHELGHHVDWGENPDRFRFSRGVDPELEGFAVGYAHAHTKDRPGNIPEPLSYESMHHRAAFQQNFYRASGRMVADAKAEIEAARQPVSAQRIPPWDHKAAQQLHLYGRNADVFETETERDFGQWPLRNYTTEKEEPLDTIRLGGGAPKALADRVHPGITQDSHTTGRAIMASMSGPDRYDRAVGAAFGDAPPRRPANKQRGWPK